MSLIARLKVLVGKQLEGLYIKKESVHIEQLESDCSKSRIGSKGESSVRTLLDRRRLEQSHLQRLIEFSGLKSKIKSYGKKIEFIYQGHKVEGAQLLSGAAFPTRALDIAKCIRAELTNLPTKTPLKMSSYHLLNFFMVKAKYGNSNRTELQLIRHRQPKTGSKSSRLSKTGSKSSRLLWCAGSPDLNPIENIWSYMNPKMVPIKITSFSILTRVREFGLKFQMKSVWS